MKMETKTYLRQVCRDLMVIVLVMICLSALMWGSLYLGPLALATTPIVGSLCVGVLFVYAQNRGHEFFFQPLLQKHPFLVAPVLGSAFVLLFLVVAHGVAHVLQLA